MKRSKILTVLLVVLLIVVAVTTCSVMWYYKRQIYPLSELTLTVSICDVLASIIAGSFIVAQLQNEAQSDVVRAKTEEAKAESQTEEAAENQTEEKNRSDVL